MKSKTITTAALAVITAASLLWTYSARAAVITWSTPQYIAGDSDVSTTGTLVAAYSLNQGAAVINGVGFSNAQATFTSLTNSVYGTNFLLSVFTSHYTLFGSNVSTFAGLSQGYRTLLSNGIYGGSISGTAVLAVPVITATNLIFGHQYLLQVWADDSRSGRPSSDYAYLYGDNGGNTVDLYYNSTGTGGGVGQYAIGTFIADGNTQPFSIIGNAAGGQADTYLNALQLRDIGPATFSDVGYWTGIVSSTLNNISTNFTTNADTAPLGTVNLATLLALTNACYFADTYPANSVAVPVTATNITVASGGVSFGTNSSGSFNFLNAAVLYTLTSSDANGITDGSGQTALNLWGTGTVILDGVNSYSGGTFINSGTLQVGNADVNGSLGSGPVTDNASLVFNRTDSPTFNNTISGYGNVTQSGSGTLTLGGVNSYIGKTIVNAGTLSITGELNYGSYPGLIPIATGSVFNFNSPYTQTLSGVISGLGAVSQTGFGLLTLTAANTFSGGMTIAPYTTVQINAAASGGTGPIAIAANGTLNVPTAATYANAMTGAGTVMVFEPAGNTFLTGSLSGFTGTIHCKTATTSGQLVINNTNNAANPISSSATWYVENGATLDLATPYVTDAASVVLNGVGNNQAFGSLRLDACNQTGPVLLQGNATIGNGNTSASTITGVISDNGGGYGIIKVGGNAATNIILSGANTYHGATVVSNGTLSIGATGSINNSTGVLLNNATTFNVSAVSAGYSLLSGQTLAMLGGGVSTINGSLTLASGASLVLTNTASPAPLIIANGTMTLNNISVSVALSPSTPVVNGGYLLISNATGASVAAGGSFGSSTVTVYGLPSSGAPSLSIISGSLYVVFTSGAPAITGYSPLTYSNLFAFAGSLGPTYSFTALGSGLSYYWYTNNTLVSGANGSSFTPVTTSLPAGPFTVTGVASNATGTNFNTWIFNVIAINNTLAPYPLAVLTSNTPPIAYWRLDEAEQGSGDTGRPCNDYMNGQDDALYNNVNLAQTGYTGTSGTDPNETSALFGNYASTGSYAGQTSSNLVFTGPAGTTVNFSVECWATGGTEVASSCIVTKGEYGNNESFLLGANTSGAPNNPIRFWPRVSGGAIVEVLSGVVLPKDGSFHHLVGVCDETGGNVWLYIDGINANPGGIGVPIGHTAGVNSNIYPVLIGSGTSTGTSTYQQYHGSINDVAIYNYALTPSNVLVHYNARGVPPNVVTAPYNTNIDQNATLVIAPQITGSATLYYFWYTNNATNVISTNAILTVTNIQPPYVQYELTVSNSLGTASFFVNVNINTGGPSINPNPAPASLSLYNGQQFTYFIAASGTDPLYYQWFVSSNNVGAVSILGATNPTYTATAAAGSTNVYYCTVTNSYNGSSTATSQSATLIGVSLPTNRYSLTVLSNHPIAYWPLNEQPDANNTDGNDTVIANDYAGGHNAMYLNADLGEPGFGSTAESDTAALFGVFATPNSFAGEIDNSGNGLPNIDFAPAAVAAGGNAEFTVECWVKTTNSQSATSTILAKGYLGSGGDQFAITAYTNSFGFLMRDYASQAIDGNSATGVNINDGNWHYLTVVVDQGDLVNGNIQLYHNGVNIIGAQLQSGKSINGGNMGATDPAANLVSIGSMAASKTAATLANQFEGTISEVALYNYAMTSAQISNNYAARGVGYLTLSGPEPQAVLAGATVPMTVTVTGGTAPFTYQWQQNSTNITYGTSSALQLVGAPTTAGSYDVIVSDSSIVPAVTSAVVQVTIVPDLTFNTNGLSWSAQGTSFAWLGTNAFELTADTGSESNSAFYWSPVYVGAFQASFTYQVVNPSGTLADGATFCLQNDPRGAEALGEGGGDLGYGPTNSAGITNSVAFEIDLYPSASGGTGVAFGTNGTIGPNGPTTPLVFTNGHVISNFVTYDGTTLSVTMTDAAAGNSFATNMAMNISNILGTNVAYVGFTGADGGSKSTQVVSNFVFIPLIDLSIQTSGTSNLFSWPTGVGGYVLQQSSSLNPASWATVTNAVNVVSNENQVAVPIPAHTKFYRLLLSLP